MTHAQRRFAAWLLLAILGFGVTAEARAQREAPNEAHGIVKAVDAAAGTITITEGANRRDATGVDKTYKLAKEVEVAISVAFGRAGVYREAKLADLAAGLQVSLALSADKMSTDSILVEGPGVRGQLKSVDASKNSIVVSVGGGREPVGEEQAFTVAADAEIVADDGRGRRFSVHEVKLGDLAQGSMVSLRLSLDKKVALVVFVEGASSYGTIKALDAEKRTVTLTTRPSRGDDAGEEKELSVAKDALVLRDDGKGRRLSLKEVKLADVTVGSTAQVRLSADQSTITMLRAEGPMLMGMLKAVDAAKGTIVIAIPKNREESDEKTLTVAKDVRVTLDGTATKLGDLKPADGGPFIQLRLTFDQKTVQSITARLPGSR